MRPRAARRGRNARTPPDSGRLRTTIPRIHARTSPADAAASSHLSTSPPAADLFRASLSHFDTRYWSDATVEPIFANIRYNKGLDRFTLRGRTKVDGQWKLFCLVHNIETLANNGYAA